MAYEIKGDLTVQRDLITNRNLTVTGSFTVNSQTVTSILGQVADDTAPVLGGDLDTAGYGINASTSDLNLSTTSGDIYLTSNSGKVFINPAANRFSLPNTAPGSAGKALIALTGTTTTWADVVTSVGLTAGSSKINITGSSPITTSGSFSIDVSESDLSLNNIGGTLGSTKGGTGFSTYSTGDLVYASASNTLSKLAIGSLGQVLTIGTGSSLSWVLPATGTVTSVTVAAGSSKLSSTGSPITSTGTITLDVVEANLTHNNIGGTLGVAKGGTGATTLTGVLKGNGTSALSAATAGTDFVAPGTSTTFTSKQLFVAPTTSTASITLQAGSADPTSPVSGDLWNNTGVLKIYNGSSTKTIAYLDSNITGTAANVSGTVDVANGGTGLTSIASLRIPYGNGTSAMNLIAAPSVDNTYLRYNTSGGFSWQTISGSGTVTSITAGGGLSGGTITTSGTVALNITGQTAGTVTGTDELIYWNGAAFRKTTAADIAALGGGGGSYSGFADGTSSAPGAYFTSQTTLGFYRNATDQITWVNSSGEYMKLWAPSGNAQISMKGGATGTMVAPEATTYFPTLTLDPTNNGNYPSLAIRGSSGQSTYMQIFTNNSNTVLSGVAADGKFWAPNGTVSNPSLTFMGSQTTGISMPATGQLSFTANSYESIRIDPTYGQTIVGAYGSITAPQQTISYIPTFTSVALNSTNPAIQIKGVSGQSAKLAIFTDSADAVLSYVGGDGTIGIPDGSLSAPSISFVNSPSTGIASLAANRLSLITTNYESIRIDPSYGQTVIGAYSSTGAPPVSVSGSIPSLTVEALNNGNPAIHLRGASGQSANILQVTDSSDVTLGALSADGKLLAPDGTVSAPSISLLSETSTGLYKISAGNLGLTVSGTNVATFATGIVLNGATGGDQGAGTINTTGVYVNGTLLTSGSGSPGGSTSQIQYNNAGTFDGVSVLTFDGTNQIKITSAADSVPTVIKANATQTTNLLDFQNSAATVLSSISGSGIFIAPLGAASAPGVAFLGRTNTGIYSSAASTLDFTAGGTRRATVSSNGITIQSGFIQHTVSATVSAAGTTQGTGTALTAGVNIITTVASGTGVVLPTAVAGRQIFIRNAGANTLNIYPATGAAINTAGTNNAITLATNVGITLYASSATQWYS